MEKYYHQELLTFAKKNKGNYQFQLKEQEI